MADAATDNPLGLTPDDLEWFTEHGWNGYLPTLLGQSEVAFLCSRCRRVLTYGRQPNRLCLPCKDRRRSHLCYSIGLVLMIVGVTMLYLVNR